MQRNDGENDIEQKSGFAMLLGRPSAGKSTLVNAVCGHKVSIVSAVPQTTRNTIRGIYTDGRGQIVFLDTPGLHESDRKINLRMKAIVSEQLPEADALLYLLDRSRPPGAEERMIAEIVREQTVPTIVVVTKSDLPSANPRGIEPFLEEMGFAEHPIFSVGGLNAIDDGPPRDATTEDATGIETLLDAIFSRLPFGAAWYPDEYYTDQPPQFRIAEIIREQAIQRARQELPHALYVEVEDLEQDAKRIWARTFLYVERSSQQGILVGKKGATITAIRKESERILSGLFPVPVRLSLQVKVRPKWRRDETTLNRLIY